jgi:hypothetical protein
MLKTLTVAVAAIAFLCGFAPAGDKDPATGKDRAKLHKPKENEEMADMMLETYKNMGAMFYVQIHEDPKAGQFWVTKTSSEFSGTKFESTQAWQVTKVEGDKATVENDTGFGVILAYQVEFKKKVANFNNVKKAWIGKVGGKAEELKIMENAAGAGEDEDDGEEPAKPEAPAAEDFKDLEIGGGTWSGKKTTVVMEAGTSIIWIADKGWFGGMVKMEFSMEAGSTKTELTSHGENGEAWLKWDTEAKAEPAKEEPKKDEPAKEAPAKEQPKKTEDAKPATPPEKAPEKAPSKD